MKSGTTGDRASFELALKPFPRIDALDNDRARFGAGDLPFGVVEFVCVSLSESDAIGIVPNECIEAVAVGRAVLKDSPAREVVGDEEHVEVVDNGADSWRGVVASEVYEEIDLEWYERSWFDQHWDFKLS